MFSKMERFTDTENYVPPVGFYNVEDNHSGIAFGFIKSDRFMDSTDLDTSVNVSVCSVSSAQSLPVHNSAARVPKPVLIKSKHLPAKHFHSNPEKQKGRRDHVLMVELEKLNKLCMDKDKEVADLKSRYESACEEAKNLLLSTKANNSKMIEELEAKKLNLQEQVETLAQDVMRCGLCSDGLQQQVKFLTNEIGSSKQELVAMKEALKEKEFELLSLEKEHKKLLDKLKLSEQSLTNLELKLADERCNSNELEKVLGSKVTAMQELEHKSALEANSYKQQISTLEQRIATEEMERSRLEEKLAFAEEQQFEAKKCLQEVQNTAEIWKAEKNKAEESLSLLQVRRNGTEATKDIEGVKQLLWTREELKAAKKRISLLEEEISRTVSTAEEKATAVRQELSRRLVDTQKRLSSQKASFNKQKEDRDGTMTTMQRDLDKLKDDNVKLAAESARWKGHARDLEVKYQPLMDQLEAMDFHKSQSSFAQAEFLRVSADYAKLLGHQNHKQKIHYVVKLKEENVSLKQENARLKSEVVKQKKMPSNENSLAVANGRI